MRGDYTDEQLARAKKALQADEDFMEGQTGEGEIYDVSAEHVARLVLDAAYVPEPAQPAPALYAHITPAVAEGQRIERGQVIGHTGGTGAVHVTPEQGGATEEQIEAAARVLFEESQELDQDNSWDDELPDEWRGTWRYMAEVCINAALSASASAHPADERHDAEEREAESEDHAATVQAGIHEPNHNRVYCVRCGGKWPCDGSLGAHAATVTGDREKLGHLIASIYRERGMYTEDQVVADLILERFPTLAATVTGDREKLADFIDTKLDGDCGPGAPKFLADAILDEYPALAAPAEVDEAKLAEMALRFCTCSHWLEEHFKRECIVHHCACRDFDPVLRGEGR